MTSKKTNEAQPVVLAEILAERAEKHPPILIDLGDGGEPLTVPSLIMWSDELLDAFDGDLVKGAKQLLGDEGYARWTAAGGNAGVLHDLVLRRAREGSLGK